MRCGEALLVEALAALGDDRLGFAVAVHLMAREAMMACEQVVVERDAAEGDGAGCEVDEGEAEARDKAAERVGADADAEVEQHEVGARRDADLMHRCAVNGECMAGSRRRAVAEAEEQGADEHCSIRAGRADEGHGDGHADECRVDDDVAAEVVEQVSRQRAADEGRSGEAEEEAEPYAPRSDEPLLSVKDLSIDFGSGKKVFHAVNGVSFDVYRGETFSLVGESGSGKTTIGRAIMKIIPTAGGEILYKGTRVNRRFSREEIKQYRQQVQMIFQDPMASLNERAKVDYIISEGLYNFNLFENEADRKAKVSRVMQRVGLLPEFASRFPHEFSGGQRQRLGIARALIMEPEFIIADEPISALDVSIRAQIINLLNELKKEHSLTYLFIAHDLSVVRFISDRIGVIYKGALMELAPGEEIFAHPLHPYTRSLLSAIPMPDPAAERGKTCTPYDPSVHDYSLDKPAWTEIAPGHFVFANARECDEYRRMLG